MPTTAKEFDVILSPEATRNGEVYIERDGERLVTIRKDGTVEIHQHP